MTSEAEGFADLGLWNEAWEALEALPADERSAPAALRVRLRCCPGVGAWEIGEHVAGLLRDGSDSDKEVAGRFYHSLAAYHIRSKRVEAAKVAVRDASKVWPDLRESILNDSDLDGIW